MDGLDLLQIASTEYALFYISHFHSSREDISIAFYFVHQSICNVKSYLDIQIIFNFVHQFTCHVVYLRKAILKFSWSNKMSR